MDIQENDGLLELIACSDLKPRQIIRTEKGGYVVPIYRFLRTPTSIKELEPYNNSTGTFVSMSNGTLVVLSNGTISGKYVLNKKLKKFLCFSSCGRIDIFADSDDAIVETAVFFGTLKTSQETPGPRIRFNDKVIFDAARSEQLSLVFEAAAPKQIQFNSSALNNALSSVLATRPYPIDLELRCLSLDCDAFLRGLESRTSSFGSLSVDYVDFSDDALRRFCNHLHLFEHLTLGSYVYVPSNLVGKILSSPLKSIEFLTSGEFGRIDDSEVSGIVPKQMEMLVLSSDDGAFPVEFMVSFLQQVAQSVHLEHLIISLGVEQKIPAVVAKALIDAIASNRSLRKLELSDINYDFNSCLVDLFAVLETHEGLQTLQVSILPERVDVVEGLKQLLMRNPSIEVLDGSGEEYDFDFCVLNRFVRGSKRITQEAPSSRLSLFGAALTHSAALDFKRIALLFVDHTDVLCELVSEIVSTSESEDDAFDRNGPDGGTLLLATASVSDTERDNVRKRKRKADS